VCAKRRRRLRLQQARRITIDSPGQGLGPEATAQEVEEAPGTLTPFTVASLIPQLRTPLTKSPTMTLPPTQTDIQAEPSSTQARSISHGDDSEGRDTLAETVQRLQERVAYLEGRSSGERAQDRRLRRPSIPSLSGDTFRSEDSSDPPPTYQS
jgi:hypothetical protein